MLKYFFSPENTETASGMFTLPHILSLIFCLILIGVCVFYTRRLSDTSVLKITRILAIVFTAMEIIKIIYKFALGYTEYLDYYLPISFCSLFIYALWFSGYGHGKIKKLGDVFVSAGCLVGGLAFLIVPTTSLMVHHIFHYLSIHSMLFHSAMVYLGITYLLRNKVELNKSALCYNLIYVGSGCALAIILNLIFDSNLMILTAPINIPVKIVNDLAAKLPALYTVIASAVYLFIPYGVAVILQKCVFNKTNKVK